MTPSEIRLALQEVLAGGVSLNVSSLVLLICGWFLSTIIGAFAGSYFGKRGETAAIQRDLKTIKDQLSQTTAVAEEIKADISGELWLKQKSWDLKWQCYSQLAEHLGELHTLISEAIAIKNLALQPGQDPAAHTREFEARRSAARERFEKFRQYGSVARIVVPVEVRTFLTAFGEEWNSASTPEAQSDAARNAWMGITDHARVDLLKVESEMSTPRGDA
jgi:hypothetical protein